MISKIGKGLPVCTRCRTRCTRYAHRQAFANFGGHAPCLHLATMLLFFALATAFVTQDYSLQQHAVVAHDLAMPCAGAQALNINCWKDEWNKIVGEYNKLMNDVPGLKKDIADKLSSITKLTSEIAAIKPAVEELGKCMETLPGKTGALSTLTGLCALQAHRRARPALSLSLTHTPH